MSPNQTPFLKALGKEATALLEGRGALVVKHLEKGESLFHIGDNPEALFLLLDGEIRVENLSDTGRMVVVNRFFTPGTLLGEVYYILKRPFDYQAVAEVESEVLLLSRKDLEALPEERLLAVLLPIVAEKAYTLNKRLRVFSEPSARDRVLRDLSLRLGEREKMTFYTTQAAWAEDLGLPRPSLSRILGELKERGVLSLSRGKLTITREGLEKALSCH